MQSLFTRRSVRTYLKKEIEDVKIEGIIRAAMQAPSAGNQQPWEFLVIRNPELKSQLSKTSPYSKMLEQAPVCIAVLANEHEMKYPEHWQQDLGAACQNLLLEAMELGIGGVWLGIYGDDQREAYVRETMKLPAGVYCYTIIPLGYPADPKAFYFKDRFNYKKVFYEAYGETKEPEIDISKYM
ncbi:MAG: nitroreductase family protein [Erysipelotrichaceae bacterium]